MRVYKEIFAKVKAFGYEKQSPHVRVFSPSLAIVSDQMTMKETYDGRDISGRYWCATLWTLIDGSWKLLMEQEIPLDVPKQTSN
jgi:hypothetical protein